MGAKSPNALYPHRISNDKSASLLNANCKHQTRVTREPYLQLNSDFHLLTQALIL